MATGTRPSWVTAALAAFVVLATVAMIAAALFLAATFFVLSGAIR
jgi:hypothetical protein